MPVSGFGGRPFVLRKLRNLKSWVLVGVFPKCLPPHAELFSSALGLHVSLQLVQGHLCPGPPASASRRAPDWRTRRRPIRSPRRWSPPSSRRLHGLRLGDARGACHAPSVFGGVLHSTPLHYSPETPPDGSCVHQVRQSPINIICLLEVALHWAHLEVRAQERLASGLLR